MKKIVKKLMVGDFKLPYSGFPIPKSLLIIFVVCMITGLWQYEIEDEFWGDMLLYGGLVVALLLGLLSLRLTQIDYVQNLKNRK